MRQPGVWSAASRICGLDEDRLKAFYSDHFVLPLPASHRFPMAKYRRLRDCVQGELVEVKLHEPAAATDAELALAHDLLYVAAVSEGRLSADEVRAIGFPWSPAMAERARRSVGATIGACRAAWSEGIAANLAGGTHHSQRARGAGYCVFNDVATAARCLQLQVSGKDRPLQVAIVDLDVHQGDGTAQITAGDDSIFTLSLHGEKNFPARKERSDLDVGLPDGTGDEHYLAALEAAFAELRQRFAPDFIIYLAGADVHEDDRLGRLALSAQGMAARDQRVFDFAEELDVPVAVVMGGGYGREIETTVALHLQTIRMASQSWARRRERELPTRSAA